MAIFLNNEVLLERYLGKTKALEEAELEFKKLIEKFKNTKGNKVVSDFPENKNIEDILTKFFKVKRIKIHWQNETVNACTIPTSHPLVNLNILKNYKKTNEFMSENLSIYIIMDTNLISRADLDEKELMAILLHEIGHNFDYTPFYFLQAFPLLMIPYVGDIIKGVFNTKIEIERFIQRKIPFLYSILTFPKKILSYRPPFLIVPIKSPIQILSTLTYGRERFADNFAASYGYGEHISSALRKIDIAVEGPFNILDSPITDFFRLISTVSISFIDPHPTTKTRITNMLKKLNKDLNEPDLPKELKDDLKSNIKYFEEYLEKYDEIMQSNVNRIFTYSFEKIADEMFDGKTDYREILNFIYKKADEI